LSVSKGAACKSGARGARERQGRLPTDVIFAIRHGVIPGRTLGPKLAQRRERGYFFSCLTRSATRATAGIVA
jgi:hypothetical protein